MNPREEPGLCSPTCPRWLTLHPQAWARREILVAKLKFKLEYFSKRNLSGPPVSVTWGFPGLPEQFSEVEF